MKFAEQAGLNKAQVLPLFRTSDKDRFSFIFQGVIIAENLEQNKLDRTTSENLFLKLFSTEFHTAEHPKRPTGNYFLYHPVCFRQTCTLTPHTLPSQSLGTPPRTLQQSPPKACWRNQAPQPHQGRTLQHPALKLRLWAQLAGSRASRAVQTHLTHSKQMCCFRVQSSHGSDLSGA